MRFLTPSEAARQLKVSPITLRKWADAGLIKVMVTIGGHRRYPESEVERLLRRQTVHRVSDLKVLVVDDDSITLDRLREYVLEANFPVVIEVAKDAFDAGQKVFSFKPDMVLLDVLMPGLNGFDVCRRIKSEVTTTAIRVVGMAGEAFEQNRSRLLAGGGEACLDKPLEKQELLAVINNKLV